MTAPQYVALAGILVGLLRAPLPAQTTGRVIDTESGAGVSGATLTWDQGERGGPTTRTDAGADGHFVVPEAWSGDGTVEVRALGYRTRLFESSEAAESQWTLRLETDPLQLDAVVVTAAGRLQRRSEVAVPMARVDAQRISATGAVSAARVVSEIPGVQITGGTPVGSNIMIRGVGESRVLVLLDGQPMGGALLENRDLSRMSLAGVERVEVVKGPLSSLYGSDALGGVINVITEDPEAGFGANARVMAGSLGRREASASLSGGGDVRYRATGSWRQQDQVAGIDNALETFSRVWDARATVRYGEQESLRIRGDLSLLRERQRWPVGAGFSGFNDNRGITAWTETRIPGGTGEWIARVFGQDYTHLYRSARGDAPIEGGEEDRQEERLWKATLGYAASLGSHDVDMGLTGSTRRVRSPDKLLEDQASDEQLEVFAQDAWRLGSTTVSGGARVTLNDRWGSAFSPTVGVSSILDGTVQLRATVGRGFRAPSFKELAWDFANLGAGYTVEGFADLEPERSWNFTAGLDWSPSAAGRIGIELYTNHIEDLIEFAFVGNNPSGLLVYSPRNVHQARTRGVELSAEVRRGSFRLSGEYAFLDADDLGRDLPLDRRARHTGRLAIGSAFDLMAGVELDLSGRFIGDAPLVSTADDGTASVIGTQERLFSLDAQAGMHVAKGVRLVVGGDNLLDAQPVGWQAVVGRQIRLGLEARDLF